jgi:hypothetical protein
VRYDEETGASRVEQSDVGDGADGVEAPGDDLLGAFGGAAGGLAASGEAA